MTTLPKPAWQSFCDAVVAKLKSPAPSTVSDHRREIDGLRAVAVLPVILFHAGVPAFSGGFVGVDVFFVISGFLIGRILISEISDRSFSLVGFYERRARRILPALAIMTLSCVPLAWLFMSQSSFENFSAAVVSAPLFVSNIYFWETTDYFAPDGDENPLLHTWTLAVEEQFYIFVPLLLVFLLPRGRRFTIIVIAVSAIASLALCQWGAGAKPAATYYLLPTRAWELGVGLLAAFIAHSQVVRRTKRTRNEIISLAGLAAIVVAIFVFDSRTPFPSIYAGLPVLGAAAILLYAQPGTACHWLLSRRPAVLIGLISYSAYLWHQPIFAFARIRGEDDLPIFLGLSALALAVAYLSWRYIEAPFRDRQRMDRKTIFLWSAAGMLAMLFAGLAGLAAPRAQQSVYHALLSPQEIANDALVQRYAVTEEKRILIDDGACRFPVWELDEKFIERFNACREQHGAALMVLGDSHGENLYNAIVQVFPEPFVIGAVRAACRPYQEQSHCIYGPIADFVQNDPAAFSSIIYHQSGSYLLLDAAGHADSDRMFGKGATVSFDQTAAEATSSYLDGLAKHVPVLWIGAFGEFRERLDIVRLHRQAFDKEKLSRFDWLETQMRNKLEERGANSFSYLPLHPLLAPLYGQIVEGDCLTIRDKDHWSQCGEQRLGHLLLEAGLLSNLESAPGKLATAAGQ